MFFVILVCLTQERYNFIVGTHLVTTYKLATFVIVWVYIFLYTQSVHRKGTSLTQYKSIHAVPGTRIQKY